LIQAEKSLVIPIPNHNRPDTWIRELPKVNWRDGTVVVFSTDTIFFAQEEGKVRTSAEESSVSSSTIGNPFNSPRTQEEMIERLFGRFGVSARHCSGGPPQHPSHQPSLSIPFHLSSSICGTLDSFKDCCCLGTWRMSSVHPVGS